MFVNKKQTQMQKFLNKYKYKKKIQIQITLIYQLRNYQAYKKQIPNISLF